MDPPPPPPPARLKSKHTGPPIAISAPTSPPSTSTSSAGASEPVTNSGEGSFVVHYLGATMMDAHFQYTDAMMPWLVAEILRFTEDVQALMMVKQHEVVAICARTGRPLFEAHVLDYLRHMAVVSDPDGRSSSRSGSVDGRFYFLIIFRTNETYLHCRLLSASSNSQVKEIMTTIQQSTAACLRSSVRPSTPTATRLLCTQLPSIGDSITFEVFYLGKLRMTSRKAPASFIDDAIQQFEAHEQSKKQQESSEITTNPTNIAKPAYENNNSLPLPAPPVFTHPLEDSLSPLAPRGTNAHENSSRNRNASGEALVKSLSLPVEPMRSRALSTGHSPLHSHRAPLSPSVPNNRTMLLIVCGSEVRIISPDAKSVLVHKPLQDICHVARGVTNPTCFGFICREADRPSPHMYLGYVFRCDSDSVADEVLKVLSKAAQEQARKEGTRCDHCPMHFFHVLCTELEGRADERQLATISRRLESLPEADRASILAKFEGASPQSASEQVELYMMLLRAHCEAKQHRHTCDSVEGRSEYLGGGAILLKARRSIASSFDQLLKSKIAPSSSSSVNESPLRLHRGDSIVVSDSPLGSGPPGAAAAHRQRSSTIGALSTDRVRCENMRIRKLTPSVTNSTSMQASSGPPAQRQNSSPITNIFVRQTPQKHSHGPGAMQSPAIPLGRRQGWRQAIFKRVVSPQGPAGLRSPVVTFGTPVGTRHLPSPSPRTPATPRRSRAELRELWRTAIRQQIMLCRMEKQNFMLRAQQEEATVKRSKLAYGEMGTCDEEATETWDLLISQCSGQYKCDPTVLSSALRRGVPKVKRGQVWQLFMEQNRFRGTANPAAPPKTPYEELLQSLTSQQHAILIDLGRTFPSHEYFSGPLGSGQLALFNLLKAYSLLDPAVGYCQGLSFVAGMLLMHLEEEEAFEALRYLMWELGGRELYENNMVGLQVRMYQLTRLIHDHDADLHLLLHHNDVPPSLYAAPWFLTLFSSQFPLGVALRVLDFVMLHGFDVVVPFALSLILARRRQLLECSGLEAVMECFKTEVTQVTGEELDAHLSRLVQQEWEKQLLTYAVEYSVMHDDSFVALVQQSDRPPSVAASLLRPPPPSIREEISPMEQNYDTLLQHVTLLEGLLLGAGLAVPARPKLVSLDESVERGSSPGSTGSVSPGRKEEEPKEMRPRTLSKALSMA